MHCLHYLIYEGGPFCALAPIPYTVIITTEVHGFTIQNYSFVRCTPTEQISNSVSCHDFLLLKTLITSLFNTSSTVII